MQTSTRRLLGGLLTGIALVTGVALILSGASLMTVEQLETHSQSDGSFIASSIVSFRWPVGALLLAGIAGLILIFVPGRNTTNG
jgi:thiamine transporter ThiT